MRKLIASTFVSLDGFIVGPNEDMSWVIERFNDQMGTYAGDLMAAMDTVLLGRKTYEIMAQAWPNATEATSPGADRMNNTPKLVVSRTLTTAPWGTWNNASILSNNLEDELERRKQQPGKNIVIYGSAQLVQALTQSRLIDEYHMLVHPVLLGSGKRLFAGATQPTTLTLLRTEAFTNGVVVLYYALGKS
jgi:dihydrofolate reductase